MGEPGCLARYGNSYCRCGEYLGEEVARQRRVAINGHIYVDLSTVASAEDEFEQVLHALQGQLNQLDSELLMSLSEWTGEAQAAYHVAHAKWRAAADDMARVLAGLQGVLRTAHQNYHSARTTNIGMWRGHR
jgi:WXG100 family type VII secretion target